jgi:hypothetical protein
LPAQHLKSWLADNPYRRAVADTNREPAQLSATNRCSSSSVQRRPRLGTHQSIIVRIGIKNGS